MLLLLILLSFPIDCVSVPEADDAVPSLSDPLLLLLLVLSSFCFAYSCCDVNTFINSSLNLFSHEEYSFRNISNLFNHALVIDVHYACFQGGFHSLLQQTTKLKMTLFEWSTLDLDPASFLFVLVEYPTHFRKYHHMCLCMEVILVYFLKYSGKSMRFSAIFVG